MYTRLPGAQISKLFPVWFKQPNIASDGLVFPGFVFQNSLSLYTLIEMCTAFKKIQVMLIAACLIYNKKFEKCFIVRASILDSLFCYSTYQLTKHKLVEHSIFFLPSIWSNDLHLHPILIDHLYLLEKILLLP